MTVPTSPAVGLSVGTSTLAAVTPDRTVAGPPVINRAGYPIDDFVPRVGDPVGIVAADGSLHSAATLLADALREIARTAASGRPLPAAATVAYPAHWKPVAVEALGRALRRIPVWSEGAALVPDYAAALTAVQSESVLPVRGVIAVCDFGASATTITLVDAGDGLRPIGEPLRCPEFGGDLIDRALLTHVLGAAGVGPDATRTWSIRALTTLRGECRSAKERLSTQTATTVPGAPAVRGSVRLTRMDVDELVRGPLADVIGALRNNLQRNGIQPTDLAAIVAVGGTSAVPAVAATLSERLRVPIITAAHPGLAAATGAALRGSQQTRARRTSKEFGPEPAPRAWSQASDLPELVPQRAVWPQRRPPRPRLDFASPPVVPARLQWHRRPLVLAALVLAVITGAGTATALALRSDANAAPAGPPRTVVAVPAAHAGPAPVPAGSG